VIEGEHTDDQRHQERGTDAHAERQSRRSGIEAEMREGEARRIGAGREERRLPEGEDAHIPPEQVDSERNGGVEQRARQHVDGIGVEYIGRGAHR
jgi:hypothetical protein